MVDRHPESSGEIAKVLVDALGREFVDFRAEQRKDNAALKEDLKEDIASVETIFREKHEAQSSRLDDMEERVNKVFGVITQVRILWLAAGLYGLALLELARQGVFF